MRPGAERENARGALEPKWLEPKQLQSYIIPVAHVSRLFSIDTKFGYFVVLCNINN